MSLATNRTFDVSQLQQLRAWSRYRGIAKLVTCLGVVCMPFALWALFWTAPNVYPSQSSMLVVPLVVCGCVMLLNRVWRRDKFLKLLLGAGITMRFVAAGAFIWLGFFVYQSTVDAFHYWSAGLTLADKFSGLGWAVFQPPWSSTNLICNICGIITLITGNALPALFVIFALVAFWGGYFFYRAFCIAFPAGNRGLYGLLVLLLPSIVYWSSAIGKDALAQLFIGVSAYGFARVVRRLNALAILICVSGLVGTALARPHVAAMLATSMLLPFTLGRTGGGWMAMSAKVLLVPILAGATLLMVSQAQSFVGVESSDFKGGVDRVFLESKYTQTGGSQYNEGRSLPRRLIESPFLVFRPFPWEAHNVQAAVAALEGLGLALLAWRKRREIWALTQHWRDPYVQFVLLFVLVFSAIFAVATSNFGILVRERIMLLPIFLMLFCAKIPTSNAMVSIRAIQPNRRFPRRWPAPHLGRFGS
jgi:hypothetical protein